MVDVIRGFQYKTAGRGKGILGMTDFEPCRRPGKKVKVEPAVPQENEKSKQQQTARVTAPENKVVLAMYSYTANPNFDGGFTELSLEKGQFLELLREHPSNEYWWEVKNEDGDIGFVPASYLTIKQDQDLPWLALSSLESEEAERKERSRRLAQQHAASQGIGFGPPPKQLAPKPYVSAYSRNQKSTATQSNYYCEVCDKQLNGPKPYQAHMVSKAHKEEVALRNA